MNVNPIVDFMTIYNKPPRSILQMINSLTHKHKFMVNTTNRKDIESFLQCYGYNKTRQYINLLYDTSILPNFSSQHKSSRANRHFTDIITIHDFDVALSDILQKYLRKVEVVFKANLFQELVMQHNDSFCLYDYRIYFNRVTQKVNNTMNNLTLKCKGEESSSSLSKWFHKKYVVPSKNNIQLQYPMWILQNRISFGELSQLFNYLYIPNNQQIFNNLCQKFDIINPLEIKNVIKDFVFIRNCVSHNSSILVSSQYRINNNSIQIASIPNSQNERRLCTVIYWLNHFINQIDQNQANVVNKEVKALIDSYTYNHITLRRSKSISFQDLVDKIIGI